MKRLELPLIGAPTKNLPSIVPDASEQPRERPLAEAGPDDFNWSAENGDLVAPCQPATAIYENPYGQVVIRQEAREYGEDDPFVFISREYLADVIKRLTEMLPTDEGGQ